MDNSPNTSSNNRHDSNFMKYEGNQAISQHHNDNSSRINVNNAHINTNPNNHEQNNLINNNYIVNNVAGNNNGNYKPQIPLIININALNSMKPKSQSHGQQYLTDAHCMYLLVNNRHLQTIFLFMCVCIVQLNPSNGINIFRQKNLIRLPNNLLSEI